MRTVLAQITPTLGDLDKNLDLHLREIRAAARAGARAIIFPELSLTGYLLQDMVSDVAQDARAGRHLRKLAAASRRIAVVAGFVEKGPGVTYYNSAACFVNGKLAHLHRKVYLPTYAMFDEGRYFAAGEVFRTFEAPWGRTGLLICEDFWHLSASWLLSLQGMEVLVVVSSSPTKGVDASPTLTSRETWLSLGRVVARFLSCYVIYVNRTGYEEGWNFSGGSYAVDPAGRLAGEAKLLKPDRAIVSLDASRIRRVRTAYPMLRDEKLDLVRRELERILVERFGGAQGGSA